MTSAKPTTEAKIRIYLTSPKLPLAVYREVVAHLRQIEGVDTGLIHHPVSSSANSSQPKFDYSQSQIKALWIEYNTNVQPSLEQKFTKILNYYAQRYYPWQQLTTA
jgi:hypothetical protein